MSLRGGSPDDVAPLAALGVSELVVVVPPPGDPGEAAEWVGALAFRWGLA